MGFFDKIKQTLNIGGAKITLTPSQAVIANGGTITIKLTVQGGTLDQPISAVVITMFQKDTWVEHQLGGQRTHKSQTFTLAKKTEMTPFTIKAGEQREFNFSLPVQAVISPLSQAGGVIGGIAKMTELVESRHHSWWVEATLAIQGALDATTRCDLTVQLD